ncbi:MAG: hypothetical protein QW165_04280 [Candidatus Woesearchaeota archaeon]
MKKIIVLLMLFIIACRPEYVPAEAPAPIETQPIIATSEPQATLQTTEPATRTVKQTGTIGTFVYGLSEDNRIVNIEKTGSKWQYKYENGRLAEISGPQTIEFLYEKDKLSAIDFGATKLQFRYDSRGRLVEVKGAQETLYMDYDSLDLIRGIRRGVAGETSIDYDKHGKIKYITRGKVTTNVFMDDKGRIRNFDADETKMIIGYWRDNKIISLTGATFGPGITVSYGPDYPPFEAKLISAEDNSKFTAAYTDTLYKVVDEYVYCKYVRRLKEVLFEGISYAFYVNYFKGDLAGYLAMQFKCIPYEA